MAQRGKHFTFGSPGMAGLSSASPSPWRKGVLLGLVLMMGGLVLLHAVAPEHCGLGAVNYLSLQVGGFSVMHDAVP